MHVFSCPIYQHYIDRGFLFLYHIWEKNRSVFGDVLINFLPWSETGQGRGNGGRKRRRATVISRRGGGWQQYCGCLCTVRSKYYRAGAGMEAKSNGRLSSSATAGLGHGHKHKDEASELVSDGGGHFFISKSCMKFQTWEPRHAWPSKEHWASSDFPSIISNPKSSPSKYVRNRITSFSIAT